jgi:Tfp pilus assembly protein PilV
VNFRKLRAAVETVHMSRMGDSFVGDDSGFSLVEAIMALTVLSVGIVMSIAPVISSLSILTDAKLNQVASNLGQAEIERIRSLDYADVVVAWAGQQVAGGSFLWLIGQCDHPQQLRAVHDWVHCHQEHGRHRCTFSDPLLRLR